MDRNIDYGDVITFNRESNHFATRVYAQANIADESQCRFLSASLINSELSSFMVSPGERKVSGDICALEYLLDDSNAGIPGIIELSNPLLMRADHFMKLNRQLLG